MARKFRKLYLHIGFEKTGTTTIQHFLHRNRSKLEENGLFIPQSVGSENHKLLAAQAFAPDSRDVAVTSTRRGSTPEEIRLFRDRVLSEFYREAEKSDADTAVVSSEDFSRLFSPEEVAQAIDPLAKIADEIIVVAFMRRQDLLACSRYYSLVLGGSRKTQLLPDKTPKGPHIYSYFRNISMWVDAVGVSNVIITRFPENPKSEPFDSVENFCKNIDINPSDYDRVREQHVSLDAANQIILEAFNSIGKQDDLMSMDDLIAQLKTSNDSSQYRFIPSAQQARTFYEGYKEDNKLLFECLGASEEMFSDDFSMYPDYNMRMELQEVALKRLLLLNFK